MRTVLRLKHTLLAVVALASVGSAHTEELRDEFCPKQNLDPDKINGIEELMVDAVTYRYRSSPLQPDQLKKLIVGASPALAK